jgi:hypothetical protein
VLLVSVYECLLANIKGIVKLRAGHLASAEMFYTFVHDYSESRCSLITFRDQVLLLKPPEILLAFAVGLQQVSIQDDGFGEIELG